MTLRIKRTGGYAGIEENLASIDVSSLPEPAANQIRQQVTQLSALTAQRPERVGADQFRYEIEIAEPGSTARTINVIDEGNPDEPALKLVQRILGMISETHA